MKLLMATVSGILAYALALPASAEPIRYEVTGIDGDVPYVLSIDYDNEATNISNNPWRGWTTVLTIPDAVINLEYNGVKYTSKNGAILRHSEMPFGSTVRIEAIQSPFENINQIELTVDVEDPNGIFDPSIAQGGEATPIGGYMYLYLNEVSIYKYPPYYLDNTSSIKKIVGPISGEVCDGVIEVATDLQGMCSEIYPCPPEYSVQITQAVDKLNQLCQ